ncbi:YqzE family protein [Oceanobacillus salinisoli]|uniref:YqzE family protein n=1 Tax=Oceanobacillus salinisoli TaxID=2678611 RepID=UPI0012E137FF|nr:YqzE family protein [Oceanobacillus salinisoli]
MSGNDYLKYVTEQVVSYLDLPTEERRKRKLEQKKAPGGLSNRWFGVLPFVIKSLRKKAE